MKTHSLPSELTSRIEPLESRIAPSTASFTFFDVDGDKVEITVTSQSFLTAQDIQNVAKLAETAPGSGRFQLQTLDVTDSKFLNAKVEIDAQQNAGAGDGLVNVGFINGTGRDLGDVTVDGDLGRINAGDGDGRALAVLNVRSLGVAGATTQEAGGNLVSDIQGDVKRLAASTVNGATFKVNGNIGSVLLSNSLVGGDDPISGQISAKTIKEAKIIGSITGGKGDGSGRLLATDHFGTVTVNGSVQGGGGADSGQISGAVDKGVTIKGNLEGGEGDRSGRVETSGNKAKVTINGQTKGGDGENSGTIASASGFNGLEIKGSLIGGNGDGSGSVALAGFTPMLKVGGSVFGGDGDGSGVLIAGSVRNFSIAHDLVGGSVSGADSLERSGHIFVGRIDTFKIGGSVFAGVDDSTGTLEHSGSIVTNFGIGMATISGNLVGNATNRLLIVGANGNDDIVFNKVTVGGSVEHTDLLAGFDPDGNFGNADAKVGAMTVGGHWLASNLVAGIGRGGDGLFGTGDDTTAGAFINDPAKFSSIAALVVKGAALGDFTPGTNFGIVANNIGKLTTIGCKVPFTKNPAPDGPFRIGGSGGDLGDFFAREVA